MSNELSAHDAAGVQHQQGQQKDPGHALTKPSEADSHKLIEYDIYIYII